MARKKILITGAAGNLGGLLARRMQPEDVELRLLTHRKDADPELAGKPNVKVFRADLGRPETLGGALDGADTVIHFAGVLFKSDPEKFLPVTNTRYFDNLVDAAIAGGVKKMVLVSFPHVEGETSPENPATGRLDGKPESVHAATRLEEEKILFGKCAEAGIEPVCLRVGMVYGRGILMIDTARWFCRHGIMGIWRKPTTIHLISTADFLEATRNALMKDDVSGIYHLGDEGVQTLQYFLDVCARHWKTMKPWRMPLWMIFTAARVFEQWSKVFGTRSPLTRDFIRIGMAPYYGDTSRMRAELLPELACPTFEEGIETL